MIKKITSVLLALILTAALFCSCKNESNTDGKLNVVCTVFPQYDWVRNIAGEDADINITLLLDSGTDLHSYQPTAADIVKISSADIFIYTGGESDKWVTDVLNTSKNENTLCLDLISVLGEDKLYCVESIGEEGHEHSDDEHEHSDDEHGHSDDEHVHTSDEHIWLSLKNAAILCSSICDALSEKDSENAEIYRQNCQSYLQKLDALDKSYETAVRDAKNDTLVFADRFPFIYLVKDYGINYYAAFSGCSAESEASFETVKQLANEVDKNGLSYILITETSDASVANTVKNSTADKDQEILTMNALQSVTKDKLSESYISVMESNLEILKKALS